MRLKQSYLFGFRPTQPNVSGDPPSTVREQQRQLKRKQRIEKDIREDGNTTNDTETRCNWQKAYDERFGDWIEKIPYEVDNQVFFKAGCYACKENNAQRGLGAHPTKRLKSCTFEEHELSKGHIKVCQHNAEPDFTHVMESLIDVNMHRQ
jgi:hypothetical protein